MLRGCLWSAGAGGGGGGGLLGICNAGRRDKPTEHGTGGTWWGMVGETEEISRQNIKLSQQKIKLNIMLDLCGERGERGAELIVAWSMRVHTRAWRGPGAQAGEVRC
jgi:hypothetical protein